MNFLLLLAVLTIVAGTSLADNLTVASSTDEYVILWNRKFQNDINIAEMKIECVDERGADSMRVIKDQQQEVLKEIKRNDESLVPIEALSLTQKHCVQKYKKLLVTYTSAESRFATCITKAETRLNTLTAPAKTSLNNAKKYANQDVPNGIASCNSTYYGNATKYEECVISKVNSEAGYIERSLQAVDKNLDASLCNSTDLSRDAIQCSFVVEKSVLVTIGKVNNLIDRCIVDVETVCPCAKNLMIESETHSFNKFLTQMP
ncbi:uncharacterized protein LOC129910199 [Episyrphus balteatus]|uniref:uncharacterized protein LOC129910199 n=1 Tax=Episyrphus balteatus TaxID=286459 RepID=UPI002486625D|nr:uncharacterized protein LOC129910199 [Episyrphus balteatus]